MPAGRDLLVETQLALKMAFGGAVAWWLGTLAGEPRPIFATLVPLVAMTGDPFNAASVAAGRIAGVFAGVAIGIGVLQLPFATIWLVALALLGGSLAGIPLRVGGRPNIQGAVSALFLVGLGRSGAAEAGVARIWETAIGAGVAILVTAFLWPPDPVRELRARLDGLRRDLAADLAAVADDLATGSGASLARLDELRAHSLDAVREVFALGQARRALRLNPLRRGDAAALPALEARTALLGRVYRHTRSIARDVADLPAPLSAGAGLAAAVRALAEAVDLELRGGDAAPALERAEALLDAASPGAREGFLVQMQLRQLLVDARSLGFGR